MEASKVTIVPETLKKVQTPLGRMAGQRLQRELILAYLRKQPSGKMVNVRKMGLNLGLGRARLVALPYFLSQMVRDNLIQMDGPPKTESRRFTVLEDVKTIQLPTPPPAASQQKLDLSTEQYLTAIEEAAMRYTWHHPEGTIKQFITWVKDQEGK